jgi:hypothetical protein
MEVRQRLVDPFLLSVRRPLLYQLWRTRRAQLAALLPIEMEWLDGSFVSGKRDPGDIDVVTFVNHLAFDALSAPDKKKASDLMGGLPSRLLGCDGYPVVIVPVGHPARSRFEAAVGYWDRQWTRHRVSPEKGYLEVRGEP